MMFPAAAAVAVVVGFVLDGRAKVGKLGGVTRLVYDFLCG